MDTLSTSYIRQFYYVSDTGTIFDIKGYGRDGDVCVIDSATIKDKIPYIQVQKGTDATTKKKYFLDNYIEDGDTYNMKEGDQQTPNGMFKKKIHAKTSANEKYVSFPAYYKQLCEKQVKKAVLSNFDRNSKWFMDNLEMLGIPQYMISGAGYSITASTAISQIDVLINDTKLTAYKKTVAEEEVTNAAKVMAESLGYELVEKKTDQDQCGTYTNIVIKKKPEE